MKPTLCLILLCPLLFTGCIAQMVMNSQDREHYSEYVQHTNTLNTEREKSHLAPVPVLTFDQWKGKNPQ